MSKRFFCTIIVTAILSVFALSACKEGTSVNKYDAVAQCLTEKGAIFYGAYWCSHCQEQKKAFGDSIKYIKYVECDPKGENADPEACRKAGVERFPTWFFPGQGLVVGGETPEELAKKVNCEDALTQAPSTQEQTQQPVGSQQQSSQISQQTP